MKYQKLTKGDKFKSGDIWVDITPNGGSDIILSCKSFGIRFISGEMMFCEDYYYHDDVLMKYLVHSKYPICRKVEREKNES